LSGKEEGVREAQPNVVLIVSDQMIPHLTGVYGHPAVQTPNLERLASEGVLFNSAYAPNPICAPARASLMTGRYTTRIRVWDNASPLGSDIPTICHYLSRGNYESVLSGKMHFVGPDQLHGYDKRLIPSASPTDFRWTKNRYNKRPRTHALNYQEAGVRIVPEGVDLQTGPDGRLAFRRPEYRFERAGEMKSGFNEHSQNSMFDKWANFKAIDYLEEKRAALDMGKDAKPFFLTVSYNFPHEPFHPPAELFELYKDAPVDLPEVPENLQELYSDMDRWLNRHHGVDTHDVMQEESVKRVRRAYYALVHYVDIMVGEILESLEKNGFADDTVVLFTSDHGDMLMEKGMVQKRSFYEWSSRVPMIIKYPDNRYAGTQVEEPVSLIDLAPTILEMAGVSVERPAAFDGESLVPLMEGGSDGDRFVISEMHSEGVYVPCFMVRKGKYKYNYFHGVGSQLFDLELDPEEWNDLSGRREYMEKENELLSILLQQFDPELVAKQVEESLHDRMLVQPVLERQQISWKYMP